MSLQDNILILPRAVDAATLARLDAYMRQAGRAPSPVSNLEDDAQAPSSDEVEWVLNTKVRDTQHLQLSEEINALLDALLQDLVARHVGPFYAARIRDWETPQLLHYGRGGHYIPHVDAETLYKDDHGLSLWEKTLDRDLSLVCFLNDDFQGGELAFPDFELTLRPQAGTLVCFPADHNYIHGVQPVSSGERYTLVTWMRVAGMPAPEEINQQVLAEYERCWPEQVLQPPRVKKATPSS